MKAGDDFNLVSSQKSVTEGGDFVQVHGSHSHKGQQPHAHRSETHTGPNGVSSTKRNNNANVGQAMTDADKGLKDGSLRHRENRNDKGGT